MTLETTIKRALELTGELHAALTEGQLEACADILAQRGTAMSTFQAVHEGATDPEREACEPLLRELRDADRMLQDEAAGFLTAAGEMMRTSVGTNPNYRGSYDQQPELACVDRKV